MTPINRYQPHNSSQQSGLSPTLQTHHLSVSNGGRQSGEESFDSYIMQFQHHNQVQNYKKTTNNTNNTNYFYTFAA
jgi:hypothetical protein